MFVKFTCIFFVVAAVNFGKCEETCAARLENIHSQISTDMNIKCKYAISSVAGIISTVNTCTDDKPVDIIHQLKNIFVDFKSMKCKPGNVPGYKVSDAVCARKCAICFSPLFGNKVKEIDCGHSRSNLGYAVSCLRGTNTFRCKHINQLADIVERAADDMC